MDSKIKQALSIFVDYFKYLSLYIFSRARIVFVIASISYEVISEVATNLKNSIVRYMFWGRGKWYRFLVVIVVALAVLVLPFSVYKTPFTIETYADEDVYSTVAQTDLLIEKGSSMTLIPEGRPRMDTEVYTVSGGDSLGSIAQKFDLSVDTILWANDLSDSDIIKPGQQLKIPPGDGVLHKVVDGDTLASIADFYGAAEQLIADVNWIDPPFELDPGQILFVPDGTMPLPDPEPVIAVASTSTGASSGNTGGTSGGGGWVPPTSANRWLAWPVSGGRGYLTQCPSAYHIAIDIADSSAPDLTAAASGTVIFAGWDPSGYAWSVQIDHGNGYTTWYAHMQAIYVSNGQYVSTGQAIGRMGATGLATGIHVHFELRKGSAWSGRISPTPYVNDSRVYVCGW
ncbi:M23 family metallopeptidase [Candidatus Dojkabacteria bacterium]|nr:M23 family metallopeptidase [Candidatus Dojkabacteria bacterium]